MTTSSRHIIETMIIDIDLYFLQIGDMLARKKAFDPTEYEGLIEAGVLSQVAAETLIKISLVNYMVGQPSWLKTIGWEKLRLAAPYLRGRHVEDMLHYLETHSLKQIKSLFKGTPSAEGFQCVLFYLSDNDVRFLEVILREFGARRTIKGLVGKEEALMAALISVVDDDPPSDERH